MAMKDAVLGLIIERPGYGYELIRRFNERFGEAWDLNQSTIYAALDKLEDDGYIVGSDRAEAQQTATAAAGDGEVRLGRPRTRRPKRRQRIIWYHATPAADDSFLTWLTAPTAELEPVRSDVFLKVGLTSRPQLALPLIQVLDAQIELHANELARCLSQYHLDPGTRDRIEWVEAVPWFMLEATVLRYQATLTWLRRLRVAAEVYREHGYLPLSVMAAGKPRG